MAKTKIQFTPSLGCPLPLLSKITVFYISNNIHTLDCRKWNSTCNFKRQILYNVTMTSDPSDILWIFLSLRVIVMNNDLIILLFFLLHLNFIFNINMFVPRLKHQYNIIESVILDSIVFLIYFIILSLSDC